MTELDEQGRPKPPSSAGEADTVIGFLEFQRATFAWKCSGLDAEGLDVRVAASTMTVGGMLKHLALVEDSWFSEWLEGREAPAPWKTAGHGAEPAMDPVPHDRGIRAAQRPCRPDPRVHRRTDRRVADWSPDLPYGVGRDRQGDPE